MSFEIEVTHSATFPIIYLRDTITKCEVEIYTWGGLLNAFRLPVKGKELNIIAGFAAVADAKLNITNGFKSAKLAPFVCRMRDGKYNWNTTDFRIEKFYLGKEAIHGIVYDAFYKIEATRADEDSASVVLSYFYDASDKGYPFPFSIQLEWKLTAGNKLTVTTIITNDHHAQIPFSDGWHPYFNLGDPVDEYRLQFDSHQQVEFDADLLPTGSLITDTRFEKGSSLKNISLDNCFELNKNQVHPKCVLSNKNLQLVIEPDASYPYLQVYIPDDREKIAIENLSSAPDAFNNKMGLLVLDPHQAYSFSTSYTVSAG